MQPQRRGSAAPAGTHPRVSPVPASAPSQPRHQQLGKGGGRSGALHPKSLARESFLQPKAVAGRAPQPVLALSCGGCGHAACRQRLLHRAALRGMRSTLGRGEEPDRFTKEKWLCTTGVDVWSDFRQKHGIHDWHRQCAGHRRQRTAGWLSLLSSGCYGLGRNYLLLKALLFFLHILHLHLQLLDLSDIRCRLRKEKEQQWEQTRGLGAEGTRHEERGAEGWLMPAPPTTKRASRSHTGLKELNSPDSMQLS